MPSSKKKATNTLCSKRKVWVFCLVPYTPDLQLKSLLRHMWGQAVTKTDVSAFPLPHILLSQHWGQKAGSCICETQVFCPWAIPPMFQKSFLYIFPYPYNIGLKFKDSELAFLFIIISVLTSLLNLTQATLLYPLCFHGFPIFFMAVTLHKS